jgi:hypothetical protein
MKKKMRREEIVTGAAKLFSKNRAGRKGVLAS